MIDTTSMQKEIPDNLRFVHFILLRRKNVSQGIAHQFHTNL